MLISGSIEGEGRPGLFQSTKTLEGFEKECEFRQLPHDEASRSLAIKLIVFGR
jgi:hypothetical protein